MSNRPGYDALWLAFGLSHASWLTMPRAFMHAMPDDWQQRMAVLLAEWEATWEWPEELGVPYVSQQVNGRFAAFPEYVLNYRHPNAADFEACRKKDVPVWVDELCQRVMRKRGKVYPRTCYRCGLTGPCVTSNAQLATVTKEHGE